MRLGFISWNIRGSATCLPLLSALDLSIADYWVIQLLEAKHFSQKDILPLLTKGFTPVSLPDDILIPETGNVSGIKVFSNLPPGDIHVFGQESGTLAFEILVGENPLVYYALHLRSKMWDSREDVQREFVGKLISKLGLLFYAHYSKRISHVDDLLIYCGDFNFNPYELAMVHNEGFRAGSSRELVGYEKARSNRSVHYPRLYNPFWSQLGDYVPTTGNEKLPGSYFFKNPQAGQDYHWHMPDGALFSDSAASLLDLSSVGVVPLQKQVGIDFRIFNKQYSDHFPVQFVLEL